MKVIEVSSKAHVKEFLMLPVKLYKKEKHWLRPLDNDVEEVFDTCLLYTSPSPRDA